MVAEAATLELAEEPQFRRWIADKFLAPLAEQDYGLELAHGGTERLREGVKLAGGTYALFRALLSLDPRLEFSPAGKGDVRKAETRKRRLQRVAALRDQLNAAMDKTPLQYAPEAQQGIRMLSTEIDRQLTDWTRIVDHNETSEWTGTSRMRVTAVHWGAFEQVAQWGYPEQIELIQQSRNGFLRLRHGKVEVDQPCPYFSSNDMASRLRTVRRECRAILIEMYRRR